MGAEWILVTDDSLQQDIVILITDNKQEKKMTSYFLPTGRIEVNEAVRNSRGILGEVTMPEHILPAGVDRGSNEHLHFITLTVAIDYMRNADALWAAEKAMSLKLLSPRPPVAMITPILGGFINSSICASSSDTFVSNSSTREVSIDGVGFANHPTAAPISKAITIPA